MKLKQIALLAMGLLGTTAAFAGVTAAQIEAARVAGTLDQAWISGASAPAKTIYEGWVGTGANVGCDPGTNSIFTNQASTNTNRAPGSIGNYYAYACSRAGRTRLLYVTTDGGSLNAYIPHTLGTNLARVQYVAKAGNGCVATTGYSDSTNPDMNADVYKSCALAGTSIPTTGVNAGVITAAQSATNLTAVQADPNAPQKPVGGFSDVEAALFDSTIGGGNVSSKGTEGSANVTQAFGIAVSTPLYRAMQTAQGVTAAQIAADTTFDPALAPNISKHQYTSIIVSGGLYVGGTWDQVIGTAGAGKSILLERRADTSGTQASSNSFFLANPCSAGLVAQLGVAGPADSPNIVANAGSGDVKTRITTAANAGNFAIGVLSAENNWRTEAGASAGYRYIKLNGVHPEAGDVVNARATMTNGSYEFLKELKYFVANTATGFGSTIIPQIATALSNPLPAACSFFPRGLALNPLAGSSCGATEVTKVTSLGNNCSPFQFAQ